MARDIQEGKGKFTGFVTISYPYLLPSSLKFLPLMDRRGRQGVGCTMVRAPVVLLLE